MSRRVHALNAYEVALTSSVSDASLTFPVETVTGLTVPLYLAIDPDDPLKREYIKVTAINGLLLEVGSLANRGLLGTSGGLPLGHEQGARIRTVPVGQWLGDLFSDIEDLELWGSNHVSNPGAHPQYVEKAGDQMTGFLSVYANPTQALHAVPKQYLESVVGTAVPSGVISPYGGATAPTGYLLCDGAQVSRAAYPDLFGVIGEAYGPGDGSTTFLLPDLRGRFTLGKADAGTGAVLGESGGELDASLDLAHTHATSLSTQSAGSHSHSVSGTTGATAALTSAPNNPQEKQVAGSSHTHGFSATSSGVSSHTHGITGDIDSALGVENLPNPAYQVVQHIIKT